MQNDPKPPSPPLVSKRDYDVLLSLASGGKSSRLGQLEEELSLAEVVPEENLPQNVVGMHSAVALSDLESGNETQLTLVYPHEADLEAGKVSVLAPLGMALIGRREGEQASWKTPNGSARRFRLLRVERKRAA